MGLKHFIIAVAAILFLASGVSAQPITDKKIGKVPERLHDAAGNELTSTLNSGKQSLDVNSTGPVTGPVNLTASSVLTGTGTLVLAISGAKGAGVTVVGGMFGTLTPEVSQDGGVTYTQVLVANRNNQADNLINSIITVGQYWFISLSGVTHIRISANLSAGSPTVTLTANQVPAFILKSQNLFNTTMPTSGLAIGFSDGGSPAAIIPSTAIANDPTGAEIGLVVRHVLGLDNTPFGSSTAGIHLVGGAYHENLGPLANSSQASVRLSQNRAFHSNLRDDLGNELKAFDSDTGAGTQMVLGANLRASASGGSVEIGSTIFSGIQGLNVNLNSARVFKQDNDTFTGGNDYVLMVGCVFDNVASTFVEDQVGPVRCNNKGDLQTVLFDTAGVEKGTSANPLRVDPTGTTTQPVDLRRGFTLAFAIIDVAASGDNTIVAADATRKVKVLSYSMVADAAVTVRWKSGAGSSLSGAMSFIQNGGISDGNGNSAATQWIMETAVNQALTLNLGSAVGVRGRMTYFLEQ